MSGEQVSSNSLKNGTGAAKKVAKSDDGDDDKRVVMVVVVMMMMMVTKGDSDTRRCLCLKDVANSCSNLSVCVYVHLIHLTFACCVELRHRLCAFHLSGCDDDIAICWLPEN